MLPMIYDHVANVLQTPRIMSVELAGAKITESLRKFEAETTHPHKPNGPGTLSRAFTLGKTPLPPVAQISGTKVGDTLGDLLIVHPTPRPGLGVSTTCAIPAGHNIIFIRGDLLPRHLMQSAVEHAESWGGSVGSPFVICQVDNSRSNITKFIKSSRQTGIPANVKVHWSTDLMHAHLVALVHLPAGTELLYNY
ncbi:MAG: hypothetical protein WDW38_006406 [Sanguina aurantia]